MNILQVKVHEYLRIILNFSIPKRIEVKMAKYINNKLEYFKQNELTNHFVVNIDSYNQFKV